MSLQIFKIRRAFLVADQLGPVDMTIVPFEYGEFDPLLMKNIN